MKKDSSRFDRNIKKKVPIFKKDLEFEIFHAKNLQQIDDDRLNLQKEYFNKVSKELSVIDKKERVSVLEEMILENHEENVNLEGLNQLDRLEEVGLENNVLLYILKNYQTILVRDDSNKDRNIIYQTSFFTYINPLTFGEEVGKLYKNLKKAKYINCSGPTFRSIFSDTNSFGKVNWLKSQSSFQLFIQKLVAKENVICRALWVKAAACFLINGEEKTNKQLGKVEEPSSNDALLIRECIKDFQ